MTSYMLVVLSHYKYAHMSYLHALLHYIRENDQKFRNAFIYSHKTFVSQCLLTNPVVLYSKAKESPPPPPPPPTTTGFSIILISFRIQRHFFYLIGQSHT